MANYSKLIYAKSLDAVTKNASDLVSYNGSTYEVNQENAVDKLMFIGENGNADNTDKYIIAHGVLFNGSNTWRDLQVNGTSINSNPLNFLSGEGITLSHSDGNLTFGIASSLNSSVIFNSIYTNGTLNNAATEGFTGLNLRGTDAGAVTVTASDNGDITFDVKTSHETDSSKKEYGVQKDEDGNLYVAVPWVDTNDNTTYNLTTNESAASGTVITELTLDDTTFTKSYANLGDVKMSTTEGAKTLQEELTTLENAIKQSQAVASAGMYYAGPISSNSLPATANTGITYKSTSTFDIVTNTDEGATVNVSVKHGDALVARNVTYNDTNYLIWDLIPSGDDPSFGTIKISETASLNASTASDVLALNADGVVTLGISDSKLLISHAASGVVSGNYGADKDESGIIKVPTFTVDSKGHVTVASEYELNLNELAQPTFTTNSSMFTFATANGSVTLNVSKFVSGKTSDGDTVSTDKVTFGDSFEMDSNGNVDIHWTVFE